MHRLSRCLLSKEKRTSRKIPRMPAFDPSATFEFIEASGQRNRLGSRRLALRSRTINPAVLPPPSTSAHLYYQATTAKVTLSSWAEGCCQLTSTFSFLGLLGKSDPRLRHIKKRKLGSGIRCVLRNS